MEKQIKHHISPRKSVIKFAEDLGYKTVVEAQNKIGIKEFKKRFRDAKL